MQGTSCRRRGRRRWLSNGPCGFARARHTAGNGVERNSRCVDTGQDEILPPSLQHMFQEELPIWISNATPQG